MDKFLVGGSRRRDRPSYIAYIFLLPAGGWEVYKRVCQLVSGLVGYVTKKYLSSQKLSVGFFWT